MILGQKSTLSKKDVAEALHYIDKYWDNLTRKADASSSTLIPLPHAYIIPSLGNDSFKFEEQYYWDSYFSALGIENEELLCGMLDNLIFLFEKFGLIPNANRYYFTSRSQPPILTSFIFHIYDTYNKSNAWLESKIATAKKEYTDVWMHQEHPHNRNVYNGLSRYYDINVLHDLAEAESGWDMTPRFKRQCLDFLPIDLNCMLYKYEADFARAANILGHEAEERAWLYAAEERAYNVTELMWHDRKGFFFDYNYHEQKQGSVWSLAAYYALWSGLASGTQAAKLVDNLDKFVKKGGLTTTGGTFMYTALFGSNKTQWAYPNGWAPLHYITTEGLEKYGYKKEANRIARNWLTTCNDWFMLHQEFLEKYNVVNPMVEPVEGLYPSQSGFGWTNSIFVFYCNKYLHTDFVHYHDEKSNSPLKKIKRKLRTSGAIKHPLK